MKYKIFNEDCVATMQKMIRGGYSEVDTILTSPPYNMTKRKGGYADKEKRYDVYNDWQTEMEYIDWMVNVFNLFNEILKKKGNILLNLSYSIENPMLPYKVIYNIDKLTPFTIVDTICWKKSNCVLFPANRNRISRLCEFIFVIARKTEINSFTTNRKVTKISPNGQRYYEPVVNFIEAKNNDGACKLNKATYSSDLCEQLLDIYTPPHSVVYDPFNGTGTTGVACKHKDMEWYFGSELSKKQCDYSIERIEKEYEEN